MTLLGTTMKHVLNVGGKMPKKPKTLETKLRSAIRLIWSRSKERREILTKSSYDSFCGLENEYKTKSFKCPICKKEWPIQMAEVDHEPPIGPLESWKDTSKFIGKMFFGPQRAICKLCHKKKTALQRRKK
jgi:hypothetical protein